MANEKIIQAVVACVAILSFAAAGIFAIHEKTTQYKLCLEALKAGFNLECKR